MIRFYYEETPSEGGGGLVEFTDRVNLSGERVHVTTSAEMGAIGSNSIIVDDPDGDWSTTGHRRVWIMEDSAPADNQLIFWGYTANRTISRIDGGEQTGAARQWVVNLTDINTILARKVMAGNDTDRPEESDVDRIQWLASTGEAGNIADWTTFVSTASPVTMSESDYNGQMLTSIVDDLSQQSQKNWYLRWLSDGYDYVSALWYGADTVAACISDLKISNVLSDIDNVDVWEASLDSQLEKDPSRVFSGMFGNYDGGYTYQTNFDTLDDYANRDTITSWPNVKSLTRAQVRAQRQLATLNTEEDVITTTIWVTPEHVNDAHAGDQIQVRFTHFPGYETFRSCRVLNRTVTFVTPERYKIEYVVSPNAVPVATADVLVAFINVGGPAQGGSAPTDLSTNAWTQLFWTGVYSNAGQFPGPGGPGGFGIWVRNVVPGESATVIETLGGASKTTNIWVFQVAGATLAGLQEDHGVDTVPYAFGSEVTLDSPSAAVDSVWLGAWMLQKVTYGQYTVLTNSQGNVLGAGDVTGINVATAGQCGVNDHAPPTAHLGYATGTGVLTLGAEFQCDGAGPGDYNFYGRGFGGVLLELVDAFSVVQGGFNAVTNANCAVTMPSLP